MNRLRLLKNERGFTLLETLIAMTIMLVAFASIFAIQGNSMNAAERAKRMNIVGMLAKSAMTQTEVQIMGKKFSEIPKETSGQFDSPYEDYSWVREVKEVQFPSLNFAASEEKNPNDPNQNEAMANQMGQLLSKYLKKALREVSITVKWKRGNKEQGYTLAMYWIDMEATFDIGS